MTVFNLPDLGEGLPDAEVVKWLVAEGDAIREGDNMVEMSTAKAVVEVPSPFTGRIVKLHGGPGDLINTGSPLVTFALNGEAVEAEPEVEPEVTPDAVPETVPEPKQAVKPAQDAQDAPEAPDTGAEEIFLLPDLGEGLPDAEIVQWLVAEGAAISEGENMVEMSTAKAVVEVPAPFTGVVARLYGGPGDVIETGKPLVAILTDGSALKKTAPEGEESEEAAAGEGGGSDSVVGELIVGSEVKTDVSVSADGIKASPVVRAAARKLKVDLAGISGSGAGGEVTLHDLRTAPGAEPAASTTASAAAPVSGDIKIGPAARSLAGELGIDLAGVSPSGPRGAITKQDVVAAARALIGGGAPVAAAPIPAATISSKGIKAAPKVRALARQKGIDLAGVAASGPGGSVTLADVNAALQSDFRIGSPVLPSGTYKRPGRAYEVSGEAEKLIGPRRVMARMMAKANAEICHTPLFDEVDISAWPKGTDITVRIMRSIVAAAMVEPAINAWYDHGEGDEGPSKTIHRHVSLGMAVDSPRGLFVPVLQNLESLSPAQMRAELDRHRKAIGDGSIAPRDMSGATITLSNFGMLAGRFAAPIISAPEVAIVGIGGLYDKLVMSGGTIENHRFMPVSLTFDHRGATGGEAARFLRGILDDLELAH